MRKMLPALLLFGMLIVGTVESQVVSWTHVVKASEYTEAETPDGKEYLVYLPSGGNVTVDLSAAKGKLAVEWFDPSTGEFANGRTISGSARRQFTSPFRGDAVLHISKRG